jgi:hypothetical protein
VSAQLAVKVHRGDDQRQMREGLWEVAELFAGRPDLLGVQAEVVAVGGQKSANYGLSSRI